jgi:predicted dehydrogenase
VSEGGLESAGTGSSADTSGGVQAPHIGVGMLGYAFMGKAHSNAYRTLSYMTWPPPMYPDLVAVAGRDLDSVTAAAGRYGYLRALTDWRELVADERVELLDNVAPNNLHGAPTIAAAEAGKHVICEKPLGRSADEALEIWRRVRATGVTHMCAFNYRFVPAVRLAREMLEAGELGEIFHFRGSYLQEWITDPSAPISWRLQAEEAGSGALGDLGAHVFDLARYLVGEIAAVSAVTATFVGDRPGGTVTVDDAFEAVVNFEHGAVGTVEASRFCLGRKNAFTWEINGSKGSLRFDLERLNELQVHLAGSTPGRRAQGFRTVLVSEPDHPFWEHWWPQGHMIGWEHTFVHELHHLLGAIRNGGGVAPHGADFEDGYRAAEVCDAVLRSAACGAREPVSYRS